ncbi:MAG TPA: hypothetical protein VFF40_11755 [Acidimicrobiia bacterium]|nr:hypothetical protein [Acidimicrobiia bacterium]
MPRGVLVVYTAPAEGGEVEFNRWYDELHVPQLVALPGFKSGTRYKVSEQQVRPGDPPGPYLALYEVEGDDLHDVVGGIGRGFADGSITRTDSSSPSSSLTLFEQVSERQDA